MKPPFYKLSQEQRSQLLDTIYTGILAMNLLFLQSLLSASPEKFTTIALANFAIGIPASGGAILARRIHQKSTYTDVSLGTLATINTAVGIAAALERFSLEISATFIGLTLAAAIMVLISHNIYDVPVPKDPQENKQAMTTTTRESNPSQLNREQRRKRRQ